MCQRQQILAAHDVVTKIPDELTTDPGDVEAIVKVLGLLSRLLEKHDRCQRSSRDVRRLARLLEVPL